VKAMYDVRTCVYMYYVRFYVSLRVLCHSRMQVRTLLLERRVEWNL